MARTVANTVLMLVQWAMRSGGASPGEAVEECLEELAGCRGSEKALVTVTIALSAKEPCAPEPKVLRQALFSWAFNPATRDSNPPEKIADALDCTERASLPVAELEDTATVRLWLAACGKARP